MEGLQQLKILVVRSVEIAYYSLQILLIAMMATPKTVMGATPLEKSKLGGGAKPLLAKQ